MQDVLAGKPVGQLFRHEHVSTLLGYEGVANWDRQRRDIDWDVVLSAIGSHHLNFGDQSFAPDDGTGASVRVLFDHENFRRDLVSLTPARLSLPGMPAVPAQRYWGFWKTRRHLTRPPCGTTCVMGGYVRSHERTRVC